MAPNRITLYASNAVYARYHTGILADRWERHFVNRINFKSRLHAEIYQNSNV